MSDAGTRQEWVRNYFDHDRERHRAQHRSMDLLLVTQPVPASGALTPLAREIRDLPARFHLPAAQATYLGAAPLHISPDQFFDLIGTAGLLVWHDGAIAYEYYRDGHDETTRWMTNSASKLVVGMLVAIAQESGSLGDNNTQLVSLWPELRGSGWDGVTIGHCMAMTTGVDFEEESLDLEGGSQFTRLFPEVAWGSIERFVQSLGRRAIPGTVVRY